MLVYHYELDFISGHCEQYAGPALKHRYQHDESTLLGLKKFPPQGFAYRLARAY